MEIAREKGVSSWLTALPLKTLGYCLNKEEFRNSINVRYHWPISSMPSICACGDTNGIDHALTCKKGRFSIMRHDALSKVEALIMTEAGCKDVQLERHLLPVDANMYNQQTNTQPDARLDVAARGIYGTFERTFLDVTWLPTQTPLLMFTNPCRIFTKNMKCKRSGNMRNVSCNLKKHPLSPSYLLHLVGWVQPAIP